MKFNAVKLLVIVNAVVGDDFSRKSLHMIKLIFSFV